MPLVNAIKRFVLRNKQRFVSRWIILAIDLAVVALSFIAAYLLRFNFALPDISTEVMWRQTIVFTGVYALSFLVFRPYRGIVRHTGFYDVFRVFFASMTSLVAMLVLSSVAGLLGWGRPFTFSTAVLLIAFLASLFALLFLRLSIKLAYITLVSRGTQTRENILIFGAGAMGMTTRQTIESTQQDRLRVVAFIDDNPGKAGKSIAGIPVFSDKILTERFIRSNNIRELILAVNQLPPERRQEIINTCLALSLEVRKVPKFEDWINGNLQYKQIRKVRIEDLLERKPIKLYNEFVRPAVAGRTVLVTGAAGSIGSEIARQLTRMGPEKLILLDQAETPLFELEQELHRLDPSKLVQKVFVLGNVSNRSSLQPTFASFRPQMVFHAAAYKHVPILESNAAEAIRVNVMGTKHVAQLAAAYGAERFVLVSTDKAVNPTSIMGASKRVAELLVQGMNLNGNGGTKFITTRFGNVLGSNGSVIPTFEKQIARGGPVTITHPDMLRYFMTIPEACELVLEAAIMGKGGEIFVFDMGEQVQIQEVALKMIRLSGLEPGRDIQIAYTGLRPGEKLYEELFGLCEETLPTHHPKIQIARSKNPAIPSVEARVEELLHAVRESGGMAKARSIICELIPGFEKKKGTTGMAVHPREP